MWMSQRVGSSWVSRLLNSHPEIAMKGEKYNNCQDDDCLEEMCRLFTAPASPETRVRGFKQKFLYCGGGPQLERKMCLPPDAGLNALERCLLPDDPSIGIYEKGFLWQWDANGTRDNVSMTIRLDSPNTQLPTRRAVSVTNVRDLPAGGISTSSRTRSSRTWGQRLCACCAATRSISRFRSRRTHSSSRGAASATS